MEDFLTTDLEKTSAIPYFLWDEPMTVAELKRRLHEASTEEVWQNWAQVSKHLGRRREFWKFLFESWHDEGLLD